jgi:hypothetical protein
MKKIITIMLLLALLTITLTSAVKFDTPVFTGDMNVSNCYATTGVWNTLDMSEYVGHKPVKVLLYFEVIAIHDDGTEFITCKIKPKNEDNIALLVVVTRYCTDNGDPSGTRDLIGVVEVWTDSYGCCQWYSEYAQPYEGYYNKTITLQIKIKAMLD